MEPIIDVYTADLSLSTDSKYDSNSGTLSDDEDNNLELHNYKTIKIKKQLAPVLHKDKDIEKHSLTHDSHNDEDQAGEDKDSDDDDKDSDYDDKDSETDDKDSETDDKDSETDDKDSDDDDKDDGDKDDDDKDDDDKGDDDDDKDDDDKDDDDKDDDDKDDDDKDDDDKDDEANNKDVIDKGDDDNDIEDKDNEDKDSDVEDEDNDDEANNKDEIDKGDDDIDNDDKDDEANNKDEIDKGDAKDENKGDAKDENKDDKDEDTIEIDESDAESFSGDETHILRKQLQLMNQNFLILRSTMTKNFDRLHEIIGSLKTEIVDLKRQINITIPKTNHSTKIEDIRKNSININIDVIKKYAGCAHLMADKQLLKYFYLNNKQPPIKKISPTIYEYWCGNKWNVDIRGRYIMDVLSYNLRKCWLRLRLHEHISNEIFLNVQAHIKNFDRGEYQVLLLKIMTKECSI